jgi:hypothetical protein
MFRRVTRHELAGEPIGKNPRTSFCCWACAASGNHRVDYICDPVERGRIKIQVTEGALFRRLQRFMPAKGKLLRIANSRKQKPGLGRYRTIGANGVIDKDVNIEKLARKMKLLEPWETLGK